MPNSRIYMIAGEASGDLHGANLLAALNEIDSAIHVRAWGGDRMIKEGAVLVKHIRELAFMGFIEVLLNLRTILKNIQFCKEDILEFQPDILVLIDYPGFNLRIAQWAKKNGIKVHYYISPQVWAWKKSRVKTIQQTVDKMYTILPFEDAFYAQFGYRSFYVGHPLLDEVEKYYINRISRDEFLNKNGLPNRPIIVLLPGSRKQEIHVKLPIMLNAVSNYSEYQLLVAGAPNQDSEMYRAFEKSNCKIIFGQTYDLISYAQVAIVTSGTATLETAILNTPQVVCYKGSWVSYFIARSLIKINYISLVNLIMEKLVVKELIQRQCNAEEIRKEIDVILKDENYKNIMIQNYELMRKKLGGVGASKNVAQSLIKTIQGLV